MGKHEYACTDDAGAVKPNVRYMYIHVYLSKPSPQNRLVVEISTSSLRGVNLSAYEIAMGGCTVLMIKR